METFETLIEAITAMRLQGYTTDFNLQENSIVCSNGKHEFFAADFSIDKSFRFDINEDPADQTVLYAISSVSQQVKGILINAVGIYSDDLSNELLEKLK
jgi:hypothetical protein